jgi:D-alanyl-lipoteichoic acid acyltransferase DltB (MBOAT superfamily)
LRDYLYFSLPGQRSRWKVRSYLNLVITMGIGGLWHGASLNFLIWGLLHGAGLAGLRFWQTLRGSSKPSPSFPSRLLRGLATFHFVTFAWIFFRASNVGTAREILRQIASPKFTMANVTPSFLFILAIAVAAHFVPENWYACSLRVFSASPSYVQAAAIALLVLAIQQVANTGAAPFIYARF